MIRYDKLMSKDESNYKMEDVLGMNMLDNMVSMFENVTEELERVQSVINFLLF